MSRNFFRLSVPSEKLTFFLTELAVDAFVRNSIEFLLEGCTNGVADNISFYSILLHNLIM